MAIRADIAKVHEKALRAADTFRTSSAELIDVLQWMDRSRGYLELDCTSVFQYATLKLKLSEDVACNLIAIARKSNEVPELKESVRAGSVTVSNARKIVSVITPGNQGAWLKLAAEKSARAIEKEVARVNPKAAVIETTRYVTATRLELKLGISEELNENIRRACDVLSQKRQCAVTLEELIAEITKEYLWRHDPVAKAKRSLAGKEKRSTVKNENQPKARDEQRPTVESENQPKAQDEQRPTVESENQPKAQDEQRPSTHNEQRQVQNIHLSGSTPASNPGSTPGSASKNHHSVPARAPRSTTKTLGPGKTSALETKSLSVTWRKTSRSRRGIKPTIVHQVNARDEGQCTERNPQTGERCANRRWIDIHHIKRVVEGGTDIPDNLVTLCSTHHRLRHHAD